MRRFLLSTGLLLLSLCLLPFISGCSGSFVTPNLVEGHIQNGASISGSLKGGHLPVAASHVHLLAAGTTGYGGASTSLLTSHTAGTDTIGGYVTAAADGTFSIDDAFTCSPGQELYLLATGGNSQGDPNGPVNASIGLMAALGACPGSGSLSPMTATLNEVSTVAMAYALAPFSTDASHIGASGTPAAYVGIQNAFNTVSNLVDADGNALAQTPAGNGVAPQAALNTLADILAACIDTNGTTPPTCSTLFSLATADGTPSGKLPTDTATAAINIARHPASNVAGLYALSTGSAPYSGLPAQPADLTLTLQFATNTPGANALAVDAAGGIWFPYSNGLGALTALGAPQTNSPYTDASLQSPQAIAIDAADNVWLANSSANTYSQFTSTTRTFYSAPVPDFNDPASISIDPAGNLWFANYFGSSLTKLSPSGVEVANISSADLNLPFQVLSCASGNVWALTPNQSNVAITPAGQRLPQAINAPGLSPAFGAQMAALGPHRDLWIMNDDNSISALNTETGVPLPGTPIHIGSGFASLAIAVDGLDNLWTLAQIPSTNFLSPNTYALLGYSNSGTPLLGSNHAFPNFVSALAVDGSGNLWIASQTDSNIQEIVGLAAPVVTPISVGVAHDTIATRP